VYATCCTCAFPAWQVNTCGWIETCYTISVQLPLRAAIRIAAGCFFQLVSLRIPSSFHILRKVLLSVLFTAFPSSGLPLRRLFTGFPAFVSFSPCDDFFSFRFSPVYRQVDAIPLFRSICSVFYYFASTPTTCFFTPNRILSDGIVP